MIRGMNTLPRRPKCATCLRPVATCICHWAAPVASAVEVLLLQHPMEVENAKGSARLLHLCLPGSRIEVGEQFDEAALRAMLGAGGRHPVLLYPDTPGDRSLGIAAPPPFSATLAPEHFQLVVLDATWRKSRKMLYLNPALQALPRLPLRDTPPSHYLIRKAHAPRPAFRRWKRPATRWRSWSVTSIATTASSRLSTVSSRSSKRRPRAAALLAEKLQARRQRFAQHALLAGLVELDDVAHHLGPAWRCAGGL